MKRLIVQLYGGLGNQLFQYATARALSKRQSAELVLDNWSGFVRDRQYRRHYELGALSIRARPATLSERIPIWLYRLDTKLRSQNPTLFQNKLYGNFITETESRYIPEILSPDIHGSIWMSGYWQSPRYFEDEAHTLREELMPPAPDEPRSLYLGNEMKQHDAVALGIRLYEESPNPAMHARDGKVKNVIDINQAIDHLMSQIPNAHIYVFCTHRATLLSELRLPPATTFVTQDDGFEGALECLWLLSQCRHHILTNSSFYWWGAWLSQKHFTDRNQLILAADNFTNQDALPSTWEKF